MKSPEYLHLQANKPGSFAYLAVRNFSRELGGIGDECRRLSKMLGVGGERIDREMPEVFGFTLSNERILEYDQDHPAPGPSPVPFGIQVMYDVLLFFVDRLFEGRSIERFWFLETVARMPYFAYTSCLHLYETMGWWRTADLRRVHFAEEWNELHHLLIMEALGGDKRWRDRFLGQHAAVFYYWVLVIAFLISPSWSYKFSEMLETHAVSTYRQFILENEEKLAQLPAPDVARRYYKGSDLYMFDADSALVRGAVGGDIRRVPCDTLLDIFRNILVDELEHVKTMALCQDYNTLEQLVADNGGAKDGLAGAAPGKPTSELLDPESRAKWAEWSEMVNEQYGKIKPQ